MPQIKVCLLKTFKYQLNLSDYEELLKEAIDLSLSGKEETPEVDETDILDYNDVDIQEAIISSLTCQTTTDMLSLELDWSSWMSIDKFILFIIINMFEIEFSFS